jgi:carboxyl-terminal processing protease
MPVDPRDLDDTVARMRGSPGTPVVLGVRRPGVDAPMSFELARARIEVHSVRSELLESGYGYVRISHFSETTAQDLARVLGELSAQAGGPLRGLVLDLRNNPGGVLEAAVAVADAFLDGGLIVTADGRMPEARFRIEATTGDLLDGSPVTVLVNGGSASASEIVAGALKDQERATVVGTVTFGKGSVQTVMPLSEGRAIKLTTSRYYTPSGQSIHGRGIQPDVTVEPGVEESDDPQLAAALKTLKTLRVVQRAP